MPQTITCAVGRWPVPGGPAYARCIAYHESHYDPQARNGSWLGVYQISLSEFTSRGRAYPVMWREWFSAHNVFKGRQNVLVSIRWVHASRSWAPWTTRRFC